MTPSWKQISDFLCDEAWEGKWNPNESLNLRPQADAIGRLLERWLASLEEGK